MFVMKTYCSCIESEINISIDDIKTQIKVKRVFQPLDQYNMEDMKHSVTDKDIQKARRISLETADNFIIVLK